MNLTGKTDIQERGIEILIKKKTYLHNMLFIVIEYASLFLLNFLTEKNQNFNVLMN